MLLKLIQCIALPSAFTLSLKKPMEPTLFKMALREISGKLRICPSDRCSSALLYKPGVLRGARHGSFLSPRSLYTTLERDNSLENKQMHKVDLPDS